MKYFNIIISLVVTLLFISCSSDIKKSEKQQTKIEEQVKVSYISLNNDNAKALQRRGATIVKIAATDLGKALKNAMEEHGAEYAIDFCKLEAMNITDSLADAEGVVIRRVAKKNRNPKNETNAVESKIFKQYIMEWLGGGTLKSKISIDSEGHPVYYKPIILNNKCLTCHGEPGVTMPDNISSKIAELYPNDKAIDFKKGHPRGMWAITFTNISVDKN